MSTKREGRRPTLRDVAEESGASVKTVSRVVNREGGVTPELEARVMAAIQALGYSPDTRARQLRSRSTTSGAIGLVQNDVANPFFAEIFKGVEEVAAASGYVLLSASSDTDPERQNEIVRTFIERRVDGLVVVPASDDIALLSDETRRGTPIVFVDLMPPEVIGDVVLTDHYGGACAATEHLVAHGHRRIAFLGDSPKYFSAIERHRGYRDSLETSGLEYDSAIARFDVGSPEAAEAAAGEMLSLEDPPTAFFAAQNFIGIGTVRAVKARGLSDQIAVVGFDDVELADLLEPPLSVVPQDPRELGRRAAELLIRRLGGYAEPPEIVVVPTRLIPRGSGEIRPPGN